jgi:hypothetical protein
MPTKYFDRRAPWDVAPIVVGAFLVTLAAFAATSPVTAAPFPPVPQRTGCTPAFPGAAHLVGAIEGLPPIAGRTVSSCR